MKARRFKSLGLWFAGVYFAFSLLVYVGSYGHRDHAWWPMFLYPVIFPWGWLCEEAFMPVVRSWLVPDVHAASETSWMLVDRIAGSFYIIVGTFWLWSIGKVVSVGATRLFPIERDDPPKA